MKYRVRWTERVGYYADIEANSPEEAQRSVEEGDYSDSTPEPCGFCEVEPDSYQVEQVGLVISVREVEKHEWELCGTNGVSYNWLATKLAPGSPGGRYFYVSGEEADNLIRDFEADGGIVNIGPL